MLDFAASVGILPGTLLWALVAKHVLFTSREGVSTGRVAPVTWAGFGVSRVFVAILSVPAFTLLNRPRRLAEALGRWTFTVTKKASKQRDARCYVLVPKGKVGVHHREVPQLLGIFHRLLYCVGNHLDCAGRFLGGSSTTHTVLAVFAGWCIAVDFDHDREVRLRSSQPLAKGT